MIFIQNLYKYIKILNKQQNTTYFSLVTYFVLEHICAMLLILFLFVCLFICGFSTALSLIYLKFIAFNVTFLHFEKKNSTDDDKCLDTLLFLFCLFHGYIIYYMNMYKCLSVLFCACFILTNRKIYCYLLGVVVGVIILLLLLI